MTRDEGGRTGARVTCEGLAEEAKPGPLVVTDEGEEIWLVFLPSALGTEPLGAPLDLLQRHSEPRPLIRPSPETSRRAVLRGTRWELLVPSQLADFAPLSGASR